uniref:Uncharacterized protein n=1 Tax=Knipowitschia caucasica TaxID=637954 RepID=A0AAV2J4N3_KNICA
MNQACPTPPLPASPSPPPLGSSIYCSLIQGFPSPTAAQDGLRARDLELFKDEIVGLVMNEGEGKLSGRSPIAHIGKKS